MIAHIDCIGGASGDMILGALVDAGVPLKDLEEIVKKLGVFAILSAKKIKRGEHTATKVDVLTKPEEVHRHLSDIEKIIKNANLEKKITEKSIAVFRRLAKAEAKVHGTTVNEVHFHEVGAVDAIVDVVCSVAGFEFLQVKKITVGNFPLGGGTVKCAHGLLSVPVPAVRELIKGFPATLGPIDTELLTPTGAAILTTLAIPGTPLKKAQKVGYGAGTKDFEKLANVVKVSLK